MEQKFTKPMLITTLLSAFISIANTTNLKGIENVKAIYIVSLLTCGFAIGALVISLIVFVKSRKKTRLLKKNCPAILSSPQFLYSLWC